MVRFFDNRTISQTTCIPYRMLMVPSKKDSSIFECLNLTFQRKPAFVVDATFACWSGWSWNSHNNDCICQKVQNLWSVGFWSTCCITCYRGVSIYTLYRKARAASFIWKELKMRIFVLLLNIGSVMKSGISKIIHPKLIIMAITKSRNVMVQSHCWATLTMYLHTCVKVIFALFLRKFVENAWNYCYSR